MCLPISVYAPDVYDIVQNKYLAFTISFSINYCIVREESTMCVDRFSTCLSHLKQERAASQSMEIRQKRKEKTLNKNKKIKKERKKAGEIQGDGRKFLDRFKSYFGSQISQSLNEIHIYRLQPKSATKGEFFSYNFVFDCQFESAHLTFDLVSQ